MNPELAKFIHQKQYKVAAKYLVEHPSEMPALMQRVFTTDYRELQYIAHVLDELKKNHQHLIKPYYSKWIDLLKSPNHDGFYRNSYRYFQDVDIPEENQGVLYDLAFQAMMGPKSAIAVRAFAMTTCYNIAKHYPDLLPELEEAIEIVAQNGSAGVKSRSKHLLRKIRRVLNG